MAYNIQFKRATATRIAEVPNTVLLAGEPLLDTTNNQIYIGDGTTTLSNLKPIQNTQGVLDDMVTKGLLTATTTTTTETHNYTTDILQLDNDNSPQGFISAIDSTTAVCALNDSADGSNDFKINLKYPVTTGTLSSGDLESMVQVTTTNAGWGNISITWVNNGIETTFYKYLGDMTQTLTREGPFQYRINSENNIVVFIDPQTTLKSVAIINNYYCNNTAVIRMTNATYEATESVTTYALNLPTATSSTLGMVKPDNSTITVTANGTISANIPTPVTVDQTYNATSTNAQSGVAIAGAGFMNGSIVQSPLEYREDTTQNITVQNIPNIDNSFMTSNYWKSYNNSSNNYLTFGGDRSEIPMMSTPFDSTKGLNISFASVSKTNPSYPDYFYGIILMLRKYAEGVLQSTPLQLFPSKGADWRVNYKITGDSSVHTALNSSYTNMMNGCISVYKALGSTSLVVATSTINGGSSNTITLTQEVADAIDECTEIEFRICTCQSDTAYAQGYYSKDLFKLVYPLPSQTVVTNGAYTDRYNTFTNGDNIFDVHPESLSLKYDSNTLGVNSSNELTVPTATTSNLGVVKPDGSTITINNGVISAASSTPNNMVTTDTVQDITAKKNFANTQVFSGTQYYSYTDGIQLGKDITIYRTGSYPANIQLMSDESDQITFADRSNDTIGSIVAKNQKFRLVTPGNDKKIYRENSTPASNPTNFLLEKDMLDGTYLKWDSTTNKITVDMQAIKDAIDALNSSSGTGSAETGGNLEGGGWL